MKLYNNFLQYAIKQFEYYKKLGDKTLALLNTNQIFYQTNEQSNSIAIIVKHLHGNMKSRWTDFLTSDGEKEWRNRDQEFELSDDEISKQVILQLWEDGWSTLLNTLNSLHPEDLDKDILIRTEPHKVSDAIIRQLAHYPYHIGQIVHIGKMITQEWTSLSIAKNKSAEFNQEMRNKHS